MAAANLILTRTAEAKSKGKRSCIEAALSATGLKKNRRRGEGRQLRVKEQPEPGVLNGKTASRTLKHRVALTKLRYSAQIGVSSQFSRPQPRTASMFRKASRATRAPGVPMCQWYHSMRRKKLLKRRSCGLPEAPTVEAVTVSLRKW